MREHIELFASNARGLGYDDTFTHTRALMSYYDARDAKHLREKEMVLHNAVNQCGW